MVLDDHSNLDVIAVASDGLARGHGALSGAHRARSSVAPCTWWIARMDEDDAEILENALTDMYLDAESVPAVVVVQREETRRRHWCMST